MIWLVTVAILGSSVTAARDGSCTPDASVGPIAQLGQAIGDAALHLGAEDESAKVAARHALFLEDPSTMCVGPQHTHRTYAEDKELQKIEAQVKQAVEDICAKNICASNLGYGLLAWNPWVPVFGGCSNWALAANDAVEQPSYFDKRREQRCVVVPVCHFVVVLTNPRTGKEHIIDAWSYAGGWSGKGGRKGSVFTSRALLDEEFPNEQWNDDVYRGRCTRNERNER